MIITTADGTKFTPQYMNASFTTEYHYTEFNFVDVAGSLVKRKKPVGVKYSLELHFQGPDHLDTARQFKSAIDDNEGPITIEHPLYDLLNVQITSLGYDDSAVNKTKVTGTVIETLEEAFFFLTRKEIDEIPVLYETTLEVSAASLTITPVAEDINTMSNNNKTAFKKGVPIITQAGDFEEYNNAFNTAASYINTATATPLLAMNSYINVLTLPGKFEAQVEQRIRVLIDTFQTLRANILAVVKRVSSKQIYTAQQASLISAMCQAVTSPLETDFKLNSKVFKAIDDITATYNQFVEDLDFMQTNDGGGPLSYVGDATVITNLNQLVNLTVANLFVIASNARSERYIICSKDTNIILLGHELYGLDDNDANLQELIDNNDFSMDEYIQVEKGRKIIYYI